MTEEQFQNFKKLIGFESKNAMKKFIAKEIELQPTNKEFLENVFNSDFFSQLFERGFIEGIDWEKKNKDTKFVL